MSLKTLTPHSLQEKEQPVDTGDALNNAFSVTSAGIAMIKMLETLLSDAGQDVQRKNQDLAAHFMTLTQATGIQGTLLAKLLQGNSTIDVDGEAVPIDAFVSLLAFRLFMTLQHSLSCSKQAQAAIAHLDKSLQELSNGRNEAHAIEMNIAQVRAILEPMVLDAADEDTHSKDSKTMEKLAKSVSLSNLKLSKMREESYQAGKTIADTTCDVITGLQFEDRHTQIMEDITDILKRYRGMLEEISAKLMPISDNPCNNEDAFQAIASGIRLSDIRSRCRQAFWQTNG